MNCKPGIMTVEDEDVLGEVYGIQEEWKRFLKKCSPCPSDLLISMIDPYSACTNFFTKTRKFWITAV